MTRAAVVVRDAVPADAAALCEIWSDFTSELDRRYRSSSNVDDIRRAVLRLAAEPCERLVVALVDDTLVGVVHLRRSPLSPVSDEDAVHVGYLHVVSGHRRRGVGRSLLEAAVDWAEEKDSRHVVASAAASARDSNRFLARLGMNQVAVVRAASVVSLRARLAAASPVKPVATNVVAARRLMRRSLHA